MDENEAKNMHTLCAYVQILKTLNFQWLAHSTRVAGEPIQAQCLLLVVLKAIVFMWFCCSVEQGNPISLI